MADYRLFFLGSDGAIEARQDFAAPDDQAALQIMTIIGRAGADSHHGVMLWQGTRRIFEAAATPQTVRGAENIFEGATAAGLAAETQQRVLDCEEALLSSHWRLARSRTLLAATEELRRECRAEPSAKRLDS